MIAADLDVHQKGLQQSLARTGLGAKYFTQSLVEYGEVGLVLKTWLTSPDGLPEIKAGKGRAIFGTPVRTHDLFMVLARAVHMCGVRSRVITLPSLIANVTADATDDALDQAQAVFVHPFYRNKYAEPPFPSAYHRLAVEGFLTEWLDDGRAIFTCADEPLETTALWWSEPFVERLMTHNMGIEVKEVE